MTDKQITYKQITNEIDISKCEFCEDSEYCYIYSGTADFKWMCKENEDCQIKNLLLQLKRKKQECEELKKQLERKEENYQKLLSKSNKYIHNLVDENVQDISNLDKQLNQLKQTLDEIEEFCIIYSGNHDAYENVYKHILEIINEAKDGE